MLDISFIRDNQELIKEAARKKHIEFDVSELVSIDDERRKIQRELDDMRAEHNKISDEVGRSREEHVRRELIEKSKEAKDKLTEKENELKEIMKKWQELMIAVPNIPDVSVPEGKDESENVEMKVWGEKPEFDFEPKDHIELMTSLDMVDFERGSKAHGFRGYYLKNDGVLLSFAIWNYARDFYTKKGFNPFIAPTILHKNFFYGTGHLPTDAEDLFYTQDGEYLSGTAEVAMMAYHSDEVFEKYELPKKYLAFSPCFRREAGSYSKDVKGLIRVHEFYKWEQLILCEASHDESDAFFEELNANIEEFIETLGIPYRRLLICTGDLSASKVKQYDTELWVPKENTYREIGSASYFHDYQTRRFNIRYKDGERTKPVHSLNATAIPTPRVLVSLVENFQKADGSIVIPEVLRPYMNGKEAISAS